MPADRFRASSTPRGVPRQHPAPEVVPDLFETGTERLPSSGQFSAATIAGLTLFAGERPAAEIPAYLLASDLLVSPRSRGTNTPLKIYQYLRSGKPIVATRLLTHTQVLSDQTALLTGASPSEFAEGILAGLGDPERAAAVGRRARELAETKYSYEAYLERTRQAVDALMPAPPSAAVVKDVA